MKLLRSIIVILFVFATIGVSAQVNVRDSAIYTPLVYAGYGFNFVGGDFADMYGNSSTLGAVVDDSESILWISSKEAGHCKGGDDIG